jgi:hypothetical protein
MVGPPTYPAPMHRMFFSNLMSFLLEEFSGLQDKRISESETCKVKAIENG